MHVPLDKNINDKSKNLGLLSIQVTPALHIQHPIPRKHLYVEGDGLFEV